MSPYDISFAEKAAVYFVISRGKKKLTDTERMLLNLSSCQTIILLILKFVVVL
ncbi:hypothetical protein predicted by Glimmer/Critica [Bdellovibrio bacteriovorus HD100]|uniref:Uncharacterized protein n=1 Tax=Bdellovibrio bacteriovorus (strain ATCC 15356 / DSM 50701 / NCIMB 9529 / HD100) TaxID=264462 RepID=Q6MJ99_BDEBA|nr:hypothetical protein predicted by Glimmer/Critica [Bdellovibrio bacteriovorus HD100]